jgi:hypothetical protein
MLGSRSSFSTSFLCLFILVAGCSEEASEKLGAVSKIEPPASPRNASPIVGGLTVGPGGYFFQDALGRSIVLTGAHTWANIVDNGPCAANPPQAFDFSGWLDHQITRGATALRLWANWSQTRDGTESDCDWWLAPLPYQRSSVPGANDGGYKLDLRIWTDAFWSRLESRVEALDKASIYAIVVLFQGWSESDKSGRSGRNPCPYVWWNGPNNINGADADLNNDGNCVEMHTAKATAAVKTAQKAWIEKAVDTLNGYPNVIWEICNECDSSSFTDGSPSWHQEMIDHLNAYQRGKPDQHPICASVAYPGGTNTQLLGLDNIDCIMPNGPTSPPEAPLPHKPGAVTIWDTDHTCGVCSVGMGNWARAFLLGGNPLFMDLWDCASQALGENLDCSIGDNESERNALSRISVYSGRADLKNMQPQGSLSSTSVALADLTHVMKDVLSYSEGTSSLSLDLSSGSGEPWHVQWQRASDGLVSDPQRIVGGNDVSLVNPFETAAAFVHVTQDPSTLIQPTISGDDFEGGDTR